MVSPYRVRPPIASLPAGICCNEPSLNIHVRLACPAFAVPAFHKSNSLNAEVRAYFCRQVSLLDPERRKHCCTPFRSHPEQGLSRKSSLGESSPLRQCAGEISSCLAV